MFEIDNSLYGRINKNPPNYLKDVYCNKVGERVPIDSLPKECKAMPILTSANTYVCMTCDREDTK